MSRPKHKRTVTIDERAPLIIQSPDKGQSPSRRSAISSDDGRPSDDSPAETKSTWYLIFLTLGIGGLQILWSVELSNGSPYLLSLGMSKALVAFVWLAGPMTGVLVQPYVGMLSDRCRVSWGKRKPFMLAGTLGTIAASLILSYARQIIFLIGRYDADAPYDGSWKTGTIVLATVMMWVLDFSINTVQASIRAFIVDGAPSHQQEAANAWASRIVGTGNVLGYVFGYLDLRRYFGFLGREQFQALCALASIVLATTVFTSMLVIKERDPTDDPVDEDEESGIVAFFKSILQSIDRLPGPIRMVCEIQFFNWMGWFPFMFYITTYVGQLYVDPQLSPNLPPGRIDELWGKATRIGTFALLIYAVVSLVTNVILPFLIIPTYQAQPRQFEGSITPITPISPITPRPRSNTHPATMQKRMRPRRTLSSMSANMAGEFALRQAPPFMQRVLEQVRIPGLTLRRAWMLAQLLFSLCMFSTFFISNYIQATIMVAIVGASWSLTLWAPFALISAEISQRDESRRAKQRQRLLDGTANSFFGQEETEEDRAGIILGLHNVAVSAPQVVATLVCSVVFKFLQKPRDVPGDTSVAWTLRLAGLAGLVAAYLTWRMKESVDPDEVAVSE